MSASASPRFDADAGRPYERLSVTNVEYKSEEDTGLESLDTEVLQEAPKQTSTRLATLIFTKGMFGAGILAIPHAYAKVGLILGTVIFALCASACLCTMIVLLQCQRIIREEKGIHLQSYEELAGKIFGPKALRAVQFVMSALTLVYCIGQYGLSAASDGSSLHSAVPSIGRAAWCFISLPVLTGLAWLPFMKDLWGASLFGLMTYLLVIALSLWYGTEHPQPPPDAYELRWAGLAHFFGTAVYSLEGINLTLPVASSMKSLRKPALVMAIGLSVFAGLTAGYGYAKGLGRCDIVVECLGTGPLVTIVRFALASALICTHPVYLMVASAIFESVLLGPAGQTESEQRSHRIKARVIRTLEVTFTVCVASAVTSLSKFTAIVGSLLVTFIGFILPFAMWLALLDSERVDKWTRIRAYCISGVVISLGVLAMLVGTSEALKDMVT